MLNRLNRRNLLHVIPKAKSHLYSPKMDGHAQTEEIIISLEGKSVIDVARVKQARIFKESQSTYIFANKASKLKLSQSKDKVIGLLIRT